MDEAVNGCSQPPQVTGDLEIARFLSPSGTGERWRVSLTGQTHFLTDEATAKRIRALAARGSPFTYEQVYARYRDLAGAVAEPEAQFIFWCEKHRSRLQQLASTPDTHALRFRRLLLSGEVCERITTGLTKGFEPLVMAMAWTLSLFCIAVYFIFSTTNLGGSFWLGTCLALLGVFAHELGHIAGCVRHGGRQGGIGIGLYWIWPAFFADVRGSWALAPRQRLQVSLGGLYFQSIYAGGLALAGMVTGSATIANALGVTMILMATTINPVLKYDGYWILSDWLNVTNLHTRIARHLGALLRGDSLTTPRDSSHLTLVSLVFAAAAIGYIAFIGSELFRSGSAAIAQIPDAWHELVIQHSAGETIQQTRQAGMACLSVVLQAALIGLGLAILGARSFRATMNLVANREKSA